MHTPQQGVSQYEFSGSKYPLTRKIVNKVSNFRKNRSENRVLNFNNYYIGCFVCLEAIIEVFTGHQLSFSNVDLSDSIHCFIKFLLAKVILSRW